MTTASMRPPFRSMTINPGLRYVTELEHEFGKSLVSTCFWWQSISSDHRITSDNDPFIFGDYLRLTGRRGLWGIGSGDSSLFVMLHPNVNNHVVLMASDWSSVIGGTVRRIASIAKALGLRCSLARVPIRHRE